MSSTSSGEEGEEILVFVQNLPATHFSGFSQILSNSFLFFFKKIPEYYLAFPRDAKQPLDWLHVLHGFKANGMFVLQVTV